MIIDLVYTYVNPNDPILNEKRRHYAKIDDNGEKTYSNGSARYSDNGELVHSLQNAQKFLPFINHIYVAHAGSPPSWLVPSSKISLIRQEDLLPLGLAPTFQSDVVECFLYRIPQLSEFYLYSNDDFFFSKVHEPSDFFNEDGVSLVGVCDRFAGTGDIDGSFASSEINSARALQRRLRLPKHVLVGNGLSIAGFSHPRQQLRACLKGMRLLNTTTHVTQPYSKSHWAGFHNVFRDEIAALGKKRFRSGSGFAVNLMYHHYVRSLNQAKIYFEPNHLFLDRGQPAEDRENLRNALLSENSQISRFCLNDGPVSGDDGWETYIRSLMADLDYPTHHRERSDVSSLVG